MQYVPYDKPRQSHGYVLLFFNLFGAVKKHRAVGTSALLCFVRALSGWRSPAGPGAAVPAGGCAARAAISLAAV